MFLLQHVRESFTAFRYVAWRHKGPQMEAERVKERQHKRHRAQIAPAKSQMTEATLDFSDAALLKTSCKILPTLVGNKKCKSLQPAGNCEGF